jgi:site-specific DNA recombinase
MFAWVAVEGLSLGDVVRRLAERGVPRHDKVARATAAGEQEDIPVPTLISVDLFEAAALKLAENRRRYREQKTGAEFLLSGLLVCQHCGSAYCGRRQRVRGNEYVYYRCIGTDKYRHGGEAPCTNKSVNGRMEEAVWSDLCALLRDPDRLRREFERRFEAPAGDGCRALAKVDHAGEASHRPADRRL